VYLHGKKGLGKKYRKGRCCDKILVQLKKFAPTIFMENGIWEELEVEHKEDILEDKVYGGSVLVDHGK
jgi:hypothetical protein